MFQSYKVEADRPHTACYGSYVQTRAKFDAKSSYNDVFYVLCSFIRLLMLEDLNFVSYKSYRLDLGSAPQGKIMFISTAVIVNGID